MPVRILQYILFAMGFAFGVCLLGVVMPWEWIEMALHRFGARDLVYDPMLEYWVRMASGVFGLIGFLLARLGLEPRRHLKAIRLSGALLTIEGLILSYWGWSLGLPHFPVFYDGLACLASGVAIWFLARKLTT